jgi:predicted nucleotidyltransferase
VGYYQFGEKLKRRGFVEDDRPGAPVCRWRSGNDVLDVMPADGSVLGFRNAWYEVALDTAVQCVLVPGVTIRIAAAPAFLATKWDAFHDRGADDWYGSPDFQDIVTVVAGRQEILHEIAESREDLRHYLMAATKSFLESGLTEDVIAAALPDARIIPGLVPRVLERFRAILA